MPRTLLWKLLALTLLGAGAAVGVAAVTIGSLANSIFANLMKEFHIQVDVMHRLFVAAMARSLVLVSLMAGGGGLRAREAAAQRAASGPARRGPAPGATGGGAARALALRRAPAPGAAATRGHGGAGPPPGWPPAGRGDGG